MTHSSETRYSLLLQGDGHLCTKLPSAMHTQTPKHPAVQAVATTLRVPRQAARLGLHNDPRTGIGEPILRGQSCAAEFRPDPDKAAELLCAATPGHDHVPRGTCSASRHRLLLLAAEVCNDYVDTCQAQKDCEVCRLPSSSSPKLFKYTRLLGGRFELSSLLTFIWKTATLQSHQRFWEGVASAPSCP